MIYDSQEEAVNRLSGTIITYDGKPVYIESVNRNLVASCYPWPFDGRDIFEAKLTDQRFNRLHPPALGFCNAFGIQANGGIRGGIKDAVWCERIPARQRRQGLSNENVSCQTIGGGLLISFSAVYQHEAFIEMTANDYPSYQEALDVLVPASSIAVSREFAVSMSEGGYCFLHYKRSGEVGMFMRGELFIRGDRQHMIETITEDPNLPDRIEVM